MACEWKVIVVESYTECSGPVMGVVRAHTCETAWLARKYGELHFESLKNWWESHWGRAVGVRGVTSQGALFAIPRRLDFLLTGAGELLKGFSRRSGMPNVFVCSFQSSYFF